MKSFPTAEAERCLQSYLDWSAEQRKKRWFIGSERSDCWLVGFAQLAQPPPMLSALSGWKVDSNTRLTRFESSPEPDPDAANFWGWGALADERPLTFVPLPPGTQARLMEVTQRVVGGFPSDTSTPLQLVARNGFDEQATLLENAAQNPGCFIALHGQATDGSSWLRMSAVDLETLQLCGKLLDCVLVASDAEPVDGDYSRQTARTQRLSCVAGRRHLAHALERMLLQGYAQGLEALLRASLGQPPPAEWWQPAAEVVAGPGTLERIVTCWVRTAAPEVRRAVCPQPTPIASGRKKRRATRDRMVDQRRNRKKKFA
ncbi:MAG: hypothetical protein JSS44_12070 [Proteobacteria bacterium]|nr:hypothetical protein [Pseudomonadota bacterium]